MKYDFELISIYVKMLSRLKFGLFIFLTVLCVVHTTFDALMDSSLYTLNWIKPSDVENEDFSAFENIQLMTSDKEKYSCAIPMKTISQTQQEKMANYNGPEELLLLDDLFKQSLCSYRIEGYWTYELCHGIYLKQYHAERGVKTPKQSYVLGKYTLVEEALRPLTPKTDNKPTIDKHNNNVKKIDGVEKAYFMMEFVNGTHCDLTGLPRKAHLHYVCHPDGRGEVHEIFEVRSCEYEVTVLTNLLCAHPLYEIKKDPIDKIECRAMDDSPNKPRSLQEIEKEQKASAATASQRHILYLDSNGNVQFVKGDVKVSEDKRTDITEKLDNQVDVDKSSKSAKVTVEQTVAADQPAAVDKFPKVETKELKAPGEAYISKATDLNLIKQFLSGQHCLQGGTGWWRHEFCYGKYVHQFHKEKNKKTTVVLGNWDKSSHISWLDKNPIKKPREKSELKKTVHHFYGNGDVCDLNGEKRWTEVKLKCIENAAKPHAIAIFLIEPNPCEYTVVVESALFCKLIQASDENGVLPLPELVKNL